MFRFARIENTFLKNTFTRWFVKSYKVDLSQAIRERVEDYKHFNDFFTRWDMRQHIYTIMKPWLTFLNNF